jgi:UDP-glucose 4-epimerase
MFGLNHVVFRPHNVYGEQQNIADKYRNVIGIFMNQLLQGKPMSLFGDGQQTRAFSYVGDMVGTMVRSVTMPQCYGQVFNIGADKPYSVLELAQAVAEALELPPNLLHLDARSEVVHAYASHAKVEQFFGPQPVTSLADGLKRMATWVKNAGVREAVRFNNIEVLKNLPPSWR